MTRFVAPVIAALLAGLVGCGEVPGPAAKPKKKPKPAEVAEAFRGLARETRESAGITVAVIVDPSLGDIDPRLGAALLAVTREALSNVGRHAAAGSATVELATVEGRLRLTVADDGSGFDPAAPRDAGHQGLANMADRIRAAGGRLEVESTPGRGTTIVADLPERAGRS